MEGKEMGRSVGENTAFMGLGATETRLSHAGDCLHAVSECGAKGGTEAFSEGSLGEASCRVSRSLRPLIYIKSKEHFQNGYFDLEFDKQLTFSAGGTRRRQLGLPCFPGGTPCRGRDRPS